LIYLQLFYEFFKTGLFTIGGALAAIPFLQEISEKTGWFTQAELADFIAISESTPGPIGINMATYAGFTTAGVAGGVVASFGLIMPSLIIVTVIASLLRKFRDNKLVDSAFYGLRPASCGLICAAGVTVMRLSLIREGLWQASGALADLFDFKAILLAAVLFLLISKVKIHPVFFFSVSALIGVALKL
jgi:chromate transporter